MDKELLQAHINGINLIMKTILEDNNVKEWNQLSIWENDRQKFWHYEEMLKVAEELLSIKFKEG